MSATVFTKIVQGQIPSHKVYEDEHNFAFLDIHPVQPGMVLVVSKTPAETFLDLNQTEYESLWRAVRVVATKLRQSFPDHKRIAIQVEGLEVPHIHVKLFPINSGEEFRALPDPSAEPDHAALAAMAQRLSIP